MPTELAGTAAGKRTKVRAGLLLLAIVLVGLGFLLIRPVSEYTYDSLMYFRVAHSDATVPAPYSFRVVVPFIAAHISSSVENGTKIINVISLVLILWLIGLGALATGARGAGAAAAMVVVFCSHNFLYNFHNPFLTDAPALAISMAMLLACLAEQAGAFGFLGALGIMVRENAAFMVPSILFSRRWRRGMIVCALCAVVYVLPRLIFRSSFVYYLHIGGRLGVNLATPWHSAGVVLLGWYLAWPLLPLGLVLIPREHSAKIWGTSIALGAGWLVSFTMAADLDRMCGMLTPVVAVAAAHVFDRMFRRGRLLPLLLLAVWIVQLFVLCPYVGRQGTYPLSVLLFSVPAAALLAYAVLSLWPDLILGYREMTVTVRQALNPLSPALQPVSDGGDHGRGTQYPQ